MPSRNLSPGINTLPGASRFRGESKFGTWFYRIASNAAVALVRKRKQEKPIDDDEDGYFIQLEDTAAAFEEQLADHDRLSIALQQINADSREALVLAEVAGLTYAEIAVHQNASLSAVKVRIHRAKKKLAELLEK